MDLAKHMSRAKEMLEKQDEWYLSSAAAMHKGDAAIATIAKARPGKDFGLPEELELESTVAMLRGKIGVNIHCYEPEDFEDMIRHSKEFNFRNQAFHHALSAWKVLELIKDTGYNITIATFAEFGLYKQEAYEANLWAGKILSDHNVPVAYKSVSSIYGNSPFIAVFPWPYLSFSILGEWKTAQFQSLLAYLSRFPPSTSQS
jgi:hypothetical protein